MSGGRVMVTGGCGFLGAALTARLANEGAEVVVLDDHRLGTPENLAGRCSLDDVTFSVTNLEDPDATRKAIEEHAPATIYHLAAKHFIPDCNRDPHGAVAANVVGTQSLLDACSLHKGLESLVIASSAAVYTPGPGPHREEDATRPTDIYGLTKLWNEDQAKLFHAARDGRVGVGIARLFNIFGPGETNEHLIPAILRQGMDGGVLSLGNLDSRRDYVFVDDVANALLRFPEATAGGGLETCNLGTERQHDGHEVVRAASEALDRGLEVRLDPDRLRPSDRPDLLSDCSHAHTVLGWSAGIGLREGIERSIAQPLAPASV